MVTINSDFDGLICRIQYLNVLMLLNRASWTQYFIITYINDEQ